MYGKQKAIIIVGLKRITKVTGQHLRLLPQQPITAYY